LNWFALDGVKLYYVKVKDKKTRKKKKLSLGFLYFYTYLWHNLRKSITKETQNTANPCEPTARVERKRSLKALATTFWLLGHVGVKQLDLGLYCS
jgi:hypothetical protein